MLYELLRWLPSLCLWLPLAVVLPLAGAPGLPLSVRFSVALGLAFAGPLAPHDADGALALACVRSLGVGLVAALGAGSVMLGALMVGGIADRVVRPGGSESEGASGLGMLFGLTTSILFLAGGGPTLLGESVLRLNGHALEASPLARLVQDAALASVTIAVVVAAPLLLTCLLFDLVLALASRAAWPLRTDALLVPLRALAFLVALALCFEGMLEALARALF